METIPIIGEDKAIPETQQDVPTIQFPFLINQFHKDWKEVGGMLVNHIAVELHQPVSKLKKGFLVRIQLINKDDDELKTIHDTTV